MRKQLLWILAVTSTCFSQPLFELIQKNNVLKKEEVSSLDLKGNCREPSRIQSMGDADHIPGQPGVCLISNGKENEQNNQIMGQVLSIINPNQDYAKTTIRPLNEIKDMLQSEGTLNSAVINKVISTLQCANDYNVEHNSILTIIDYSLPSSKKRLWVFDLNQKKLLFYTYVSHGIKSGLLLSNNFSNVNNSKASSIGVYKTEKAYYGRDGLSLRLDGLDRGFNDNASNRSVVMHGGWYVEEDFIKKYGRAGRSWGCPALPLNLTKLIINTIKDNSIFVAYYPSDTWFAKSKFLRCDTTPLAKQNENIGTPLTAESEYRDDVLLTDNGKKRPDERAVVAVTADRYEQIFHTNVPLTRMLRRQINHTEYVALSNSEFRNIVLHHNQQPDNEEHDVLNDIYIVTPEIKMVRGYYATEMKIVNLGKIKNVVLNVNPTKTMEQINSYAIHFEKNTIINIKATGQFIRWVGL